MAVWLYTLVSVTLVSLISLIGIVTLSIKMERLKKLLLYFGFKKLKLARIYATIFSDNSRSARVLEKNGFKLEGLLRKEIL